MKQETHNGLADLAGTWSQEDLEDFEDATALTRRIDPEVWEEPGEPGSCPFPP